MNHSGPAAITIEPVNRVWGRLHVPGDKSISHRYAILAALANGTSTLRRYAPGSDCKSTLTCLQALGVPVRVQQSSEPFNLTVTIDGVGLAGLRQPTTELDAGNSGTTMRLLAGVLAAHPFEVTITGDASLRRRPMRRLVDPLETMGAHINTISGRPPITVHGGPLEGISYEPDIPSAQVKSAIIMAGLHAHGNTRIKETVTTRDHTERALLSFGVEISQNNVEIRIAGGQQLNATTLDVPGDFSSAAFLLGAAATLPTSDIEIIGVGLNPTRTALLDLIRAFGAEVTVRDIRTVAGEPRGVIRVRHHTLEPLVIQPKEVPAVIDELPLLAAMASNGGDLVVRGAAELRRKESDRITVLASGLRSLGGSVEEFPDGFHVNGSEPLTGGTVDAAGDHRMAMAFAVAALGARGPSTITSYDAVKVSYPNFFETLKSVCV